MPASYSGFETFYQELAVRLAARGREVTVYNRSHHVPYRGSHYPGRAAGASHTIASKHLDTIAHTCLSMVHALACDYDIHYVCIDGNSPLCLLLPRLLRRRVLLNVDGQDAEREKWKGFAKTYIRWTERLRPGEVRGHADRGLAGHR